MRQLKFFCERQSLIFGGELLHRNRKSKRPLSTKRPIHLVLRADISKSGSLLRRERQVSFLISLFAKRMHVKIYKKAINSNHAHLVIRIKSRNDYNNFVRAVCGTLASKLHIKWLWRPFTRILSWGKDFVRACQYVLKNELEAKGLIEYTPRRQAKNPKQKLHHESDEDLWRTIGL